MAIASTDYVLTHTYDHPLKAGCQNVWYFRRTSGVGTSEALIDAFQADLEPVIEALMSSQIVGGLIEAYNLVDDEDFDSQLSGIAGTWGGEVLPPFFASSIRINRSSRNFRSGSKRFPGVSEQAVDDNGYASAMTANLIALGEAIIDVITDGTSEFRVAIPKRVLSGGEYVLTDFNLPSSYTVTGPTTQNSRKI